MTDDPTITYVFNPHLLVPDGRIDCRVGGVTVPGVHSAEVVTWPDRARMDEWYGQGHRPVVKRQQLLELRIRLQPDQPFTINMTGTPAQGVSLAALEQARALHAEHLKRTPNHRLPVFDCVGCAMARALGGTP